MWEEPEKDKGRYAAGQEGGGEFDRGMGEGAKGKPRATDWEGSGRGTAAERIIGQRTIETAGCDGLGKFMGRMGEDIGRNERKYCDTLGGLLGRVGEDIGKDGRNCCDILGGLFRQHRGIVATDWEDSWEYRGCIYYNNRRACCCKKEGCCDI